MQLNDEDFENYIKSNQNRFYYLAYEYTKNSHDSMDVVQNAIYKALKSKRSLRDITSIKTWFYRILVNESINYINKRKRSIPNIDIIDNIISKDTYKDEYIDLYNKISKLDIKYKNIINLKYFEDMTFEEISLVLNMNVNTVKTNLYKAVKILKEN